MQSREIFLFMFVLACKIFSVDGIPVDTRNIPQEEKDPEFWMKNARQSLQEALKRRFNTKIAKNVILFVGDGMSISTVTAARIYKGQLKGNPGEEEQLEFEKLPNVALCKTYNVDHQIGDSAGTANAFLTGTKSTYATIGVSPQVKHGDCAASKEHGLVDSSIASVAQKAGKATGFVTNARVTHATPAPLYSVAADRSWEADSNLNAVAKEGGCKDIAVQLLEDVGINMKVVMGGGRRNLYPTNESDPEYPSKSGRRLDKRNIINEWIKKKENMGEKATYVWNNISFNAVDPASIDALIGVFEPSHMQYEGERRLKDGAGEPSLADMTEKAIQVLQKDDDGFVLLVEGSRIDHAHHDNIARKALEETIAFDDAVKRALGMVNIEDTLIIVTADHSIPFTMHSYATRGNPILGLTDWNDDRTAAGLSDLDGLPYTTLGYSIGPGYKFGQRPNLTGTDYDGPDYLQETGVPAKYVGHDGSDTNLYAIGPMAHLFHSTHEQNYIYHVMAYAACLGTYADDCARESISYGSKGAYGGGAATATYWTSVLFICVFIASLKSFK